MIDLKILRRAALIGIGFELALVVGGYFWPSSRPGLLFACMLVAALAGMIYARELARGFGAGMLGGTLVGAACGVTAVALAHFLDISPDEYIPYGVIVTMLTGAVGGFFGEMDARLRAYILRKLMPEEGGR
jgi:Na+/proline symporter